MHIGRRLGTVRRRLALLLTAGLLLAAGAPPAAGEQPFRVTEFLVSDAPGVQWDPVVAGPWVVWRTDAAEGRTLGYRHLIDGRTGAFTTSDYLVEGSYDVTGGQVFTIESAPDGRKALASYALPSGIRRLIGPPRGDADTFRGQLRASGPAVVWAEGVWGGLDIRGYDLDRNQEFPVSAAPGQQEFPAVGGGVVAWRDRRDAPDAYGAEAHIYAYDLARRQETRLTRQAEAVSPPQASDGAVAWLVSRESGVYVMVYDLSKQIERVVAGPFAEASGLTLDGRLLVWSASGAYDTDLYGYDLIANRQFLVSRAIGAQLRPHLSGRGVVWQDTRPAGVGRGEYASDIRGAWISDGPGPDPAFTGAPARADARIEIVWLHGSAPVSEAARANLAAWLFDGGSLRLAPCQWNPKVKLWRAVNNGTAQPVGAGTRNGGVYSTEGPQRRAIPTWQFNDVDVSAARIPQNKLYFFLTVEGAPFRSSVWAHAADARTVFPRPDQPAGLAAAADLGAPEARIEIVWPHDGLPVEQASRANLTAMVFKPGTLLSAPPDWPGVVRLHRALNNGVLDPVAVGQRRLADGPGFAYPVWDFNDVDVAEATDPANKLYFTLSVDSLPSTTNVWAHASDARTVFPQMDEPAAACR